MRLHIPAPVRLMLVRLLRRVLAAIGALYLIATLTPLDRWWTNLLTGPVYDPKGDVLIVLGGDAFPDAMGYASYLRALYAVRYWRDGGYRQIVVSGGPSPELAGVLPRGGRLHRHGAQLGILQPLRFLIRERHAVDHRDVR